MKRLIPILAVCLGFLPAQADTVFDALPGFPLLEQTGSSALPASSSANSSETGLEILNERTATSRQTAAGLGNEQSGAPEGNRVAGDSGEPVVAQPSPLAANVAEEAEATCTHTHAVVYAGLDKQPVLRIKIKAAQAGTITSFSLSSATTTTVADMTDVQLYSSGSTPYFSLHASGAQQAKPIMNSLAKGAKVMTFTGSQAVQAGDNYFWVTCSVAPRARGNNKIDAACVSVVLDGKTIVPASSATEEGVAQVYPYKYRIVPYFRAGNLLDWYKDLLTPDHFKKMTDIIYCYVSVNASGEVVEGDSRLSAGLEKLKKLRGTNKVNILLCLMHCANTMPDIVASQSLRNTFAKNLADYVKTHGYDGVDLDWEYPTTSAMWNNYVLFVAKLREELGGKGSISAAVTPQYNGPSAVFCDLLDFLNTMSYDQPGNHSTMNHLTADVAYCKNTLKMPACKIVGGLPFYSNETTNRNWDAQMGFAGIMNMCPTLEPNVNLFVNSNTNKQHYFNGATLLQAKCRYIIAQKFGGVMIWAYDTDLPMTNPKSAARAIYTVIKQTKR